MLSKMGECQVDKSMLTQRREGGNSLIYTGPEGKPGGESRFPLSLKTDGVLKIQSYPKKTNDVNYVKFDYVKLTGSRAAVSAGGRVSGGGSVGGGRQSGAGQY